MFRFFKTGKEEREITKDELEQAMAKFLEKNANIVYTVLVNDDYTVNYDLLKPYLPAFPTNHFLITKETLEVFEHTEENLNLVKEIDIVQKAVDQYVTEKEMFPIVEGSEDRPHMRNETRTLLRSYIKKRLIYFRKTLFSFK